MVDQSKYRPPLIPLIRSIITSSIDEAQYFTHQYNSDLMTIDQRTVEVKALKMLAGDVIIAEDKRCLSFF